MNIELGGVVEGRTRIIDHVRSLGSGARVIDLGGIAGGGWTSSIRTHCADINGGDFRMDLCRREDWDQLLAYVAVNGQWDFAICTHTLEDLYNPIVALELLPRIAKAGVITTPSLRSELSRVENSSWLGNIHHHWLFYSRAGQLEIAPKLSVLEAIVNSSIGYNKAVEEQRVWWTASIEWSQFMNGYLGPSPRAVIDSYQSLVDIAKEQK